MGGKTTTKNKSGKWLVAEPDSCSLLTSTKDSKDVPTIFFSFYYDKESKLEKTAFVSHLEFLQTTKINKANDKPIQIMASSS